MLVAILVIGCVPLRSDYVKRESTALPAATDTSSARYIQSELERHPEQSGFRLLANNTSALMSRVTLADHAEHSIDLQYFIFENDATGRLVAQRLLAAADRGVRVRVLLDDFELSDEYDLFDAMNAHENVEVRVFNPFRTRAPPMPIKAIELLLEWRRLNRRMHNKSFIVDNDVAIVGGRNIGNDYFDAGSSSNFRDLDVIAIGPVVADASRSFDDYWNSDAAFPITAFGKKRDPQRDLSRVRDALAHDARQFAQTDYAQAALEKLSGATADARGAWFWGSAVLIADQPEKANGKEERALRIVPRIKTFIGDAQSEVQLISPYFVPGDSGTSLLTELAQRGVAVKVLTNSLATTDRPSAHSGYVHYRRKLLEGGVQLYELKPARRATESPTTGETNSSLTLHAKAVVVDRRLAFIGSMNMDQRSRVLNTEMGVIVDCPELARTIAEFFDRATQPDDAYRVELQESSHNMIWTANEDGASKTYHFEPQANPERRLKVMLLRWLPIEGLL
jgi:putative cardiolipin synthase